MDSCILLLCLESLVPLGMASDLNTKLMAQLAEHCWETPLNFLNSTWETQIVANIGIQYTEFSFFPVQGTYEKDHRLLWLLSFIKTICCKE